MRSATDHSPVLLTATDSNNESLEHFLSSRGMSDLGVELYTVERFRVVSERGKGSGFGSSDDGEVFGNRVESIRVGHPDLL